MTNEDFQIAAEEIAAIVRAEPSNTSAWGRIDDAVAERLRSLVSQAYEEAAQEADEYGQGQAPPPGASCTDAAYIAMSIRLLKDSLAPSEPHFMPESPIDVLPKPPSSY